MTTKGTTQTTHQWFGSVPVACDCCGIKLHNTFIDGATVHGPWAMLHPACHARIGRGLGLGLGQKYDRQADGRWLRTEG